jgi:hypothetical protein
VEWIVDVGFRFMAHAPNLEIDFYDGSLRETINSERGSYIKQQIRAIIQRTSVVVCLIGNGTCVARLGGLGVRYCLFAG